MTDAEIRDLIEPVLRTTLAAYGFERAEVRSGEDHYDDPTLFVDLHFGVAAKMPSGVIASEVLSQAHDLLVQHAELRFPHLNYLFPNDPETQARLIRQARDYMRA